MNASEAKRKLCELRSSLRDKEADKAIVHINNVSKMIGSKRIKLSEGTVIHIQNELVLALKELED